MVSQYQQEIAFAKSELGVKINLYKNYFFTAREKAYKEENEEMEGYDYWNEELGLDVDEMFKDFIEFLQEGF